MRKKQWKADEMEMAINFKSIRIAYAFSLIALLGYCIYMYIAKNEFLSIPLIIVLGELWLFYLSKFFLTMKMTKGNRGEE